MYADKTFKLVVLPPRSTVYDAARAMRDNHVGALLVADHHALVGIVTDRDVALAVAREGFDPHRTALATIMTDTVGSCASDASPDDILTVMRQFACRRVPLTDDGKPVRIVTLDDLILDEAATLGQLRAVVAAQLEQPARLKPAGSPRPAVAEPGRHPPNERRSELAAEAVYRALQTDIMARTGLASTEEADAALRVVLPLLARFVPALTAARLAAHFPLRVRAWIEPEEAEDSVTFDVIARRLDVALGLPPDRATEVVLAVRDSVAARGESRELCQQLPVYVGRLFPRGQASSPERR